MKKTLFITLLLLSTALVCNAEEQQPQIQPLAFNLSVEENVAPKYAVYIKHWLGHAIIEEVEGKEFSIVSFTSEDGKHIERKNNHEKAK